MTNASHAEVPPRPSGNNGGLYLAAHQRISQQFDLFGDLAGATAVPACPEWSAKDLLAHLSGVCADVLDGNLNGVATPGWTDAQVQTRRNVPLADVLTEWRTLAPLFAALIDDFPGWYSCQPLADVITHEQDLRTAFGLLPETNAGIPVTLDFLVCAVAHPAAVALGLPALCVISDGQSWVIGGGNGLSGDAAAAVSAALISGDRPAEAPAQPTASLTAPARELVRALTGRRSARQIRSLAWYGDPDTYLPIFAQPPFFRLPDDDVHEDALAPDFRSDGRLNPGSERP